MDKRLREVFKRIGQPAIVGEILDGVLIGPSVLGLVDEVEAEDPAPMMKKSKRP